MVSRAQEPKQLQKLNRKLAPGGHALILAGGERIELPKAVYEALRKVVRMMEQGHTVTVMAEDAVVTTQRAADILGMSRPFFVKLLESGVVAHHRVGNQRRVYLRDVLAFARKRDKERHSALDRLAREAYQAGLYDRNAFPEDGQDM